MKISKKIQKEEIIEIEVKTPDWFKVEGYDSIKVYRINSEDDITEVVLQEGFNTIKRMPYRYYYQAEKLFNGEKITETEFNWALSEAIMKIAGVEVSKSQPLSIAV